MKIMKNLFMPKLVNFVYRKNAEQKLIPICPGCWNSKTGRAFLTSRLNRLGLWVKYKKDSLLGRYQKNKHHLPGCPNKYLFH